MKQENKKKTPHIQRKLILLNTGDNINRKENEVIRLYLFAFELIDFGFHIKYAAIVLDCCFYSLRLTKKMARCRFHASYNARFFFTLLGRKNFVLSFIRGYCFL